MTCHQKKKKEQRTALDITNKPAYSGSFAILPRTEDRITSVNLSDH